jgi:hypothetical protein
MAAKEYSLPLNPECFLRTREAWCAHARDACVLSYLSRLFWEEGRSETFAAWETVCDLMKDQTSEKDQFEDKTDQQISRNQSLPRIDDIKESTKEFEPRLSGPHFTAGTSAR